MKAPTVSPAARLAPGRALTFANVAEGADDAGVDGAAADQPVADHDVRNPADPRRAGGDAAAQVAAAAL